MLSLSSSSPSSHYYYYDYYHENNINHHHHRNPAPLTKTTTTQENVGLFRFYDDCAIVRLVRLCVFTKMFKHILSSRAHFFPHTVLRGFCLESSSSSKFRIALLMSASKSWMLWFWMLMITINNTVFVNVILWNLCNSNFPLNSTHHHHHHHYSFLLFHHHSFKFGWLLRLLFVFCQLMPPKVVLHLSAFMIFSSILVPIIRSNKRLTWSAIDLFGRRWICPFITF